MGMLNLIKNEKEMRRLFGKQELKIIEKQILGATLSPSEKTRLSRDIRPKFKIIKKLANFEKEFPLKKKQEIKFIIKETKEAILENKSPSKIEKIFVFGSYTENKMRLNSDIDISIKFKKISPKEATNFKIETQSKINKKAQLTIFNTAPDKIKREILNKGKIIYEHGKSK